MDYITDIQTGMLSTKKDGQIREVGRLSEHITDCASMKFLTGAEISVKLEDGWRIPEVDWDSIDKIIRWMSENNIIQISFSEEEWKGFNGLVKVNDNGVIKEI